MTERDIDPVSKLAKLNKFDDFILWKRRVFAYIRRSDAELLGLETEPSSNAPTVRKKWFEQMMKAKSTIVLCVGDSPLDKVRGLIDDDDVTAKLLWDQLEKIYTASNAQSILNLRQEMDDLRYEERKSWYDNVNNFTKLLSKLATYDEELSDKEKASKLLRTLPDSCSGFAMIAQVQDLELEKLVQAMHAEISRRKSIKAQSTKEDSESNPKSVNFLKKGKRNGRGSSFVSRISKASSRNITTICHVCGKPGHYARDCWDRSNGNNGLGRGRGKYGYWGGRGRGRGGFHTNPNVPTGSSSQAYGLGLNWKNVRNPAAGFNFPPQSTLIPSLQANYQQISNRRQMPGTDMNNNNPFQGFMAKLKRSKLASINPKKTDDALIDSGATHFFFHPVNYFIDYRKMKEEGVHSASGLSRIVGTGQVYVPLDGGMYIEGYHAPEFGENILSVLKLSKFFTIEFSTDDNGDDSACYITSKKTGKLIFRTDEVEGLYKMHIPKAVKEELPSHRYFSAGSFSANKPSGTDCVVCATVSTTTHGNYRTTQILEYNRPLQWHFRTGHPNPMRYSKLFQTFPDVPYFPRTTLEQLFCIPCQQGKARRAAVLPTRITVTMPLELVHADISGPVLPSLSGNVYCLGFLDSKSAKSDVFFLKKKNEISTFLMKTYQV